jgi:hypothetical protein
MKRCFGYAARRAWRVVETACVVAAVIIAIGWVSQ